MKSFSIWRILVYLYFTISSMQINELLLKQQLKNATVNLTVISFSSHAFSYCFGLISFKLEHIWNALCGLIRVFWYSIFHMYVYVRFKSKLNFNYKKQQQHLFIYLFNVIHASTDRNLYMGVRKRGAGEQLPPEARCSRFFKIRSSNFHLRKSRRNFRKSMNFSKIRGHFGQS